MRHAMFAVGAGVVAASMGLAAARIIGAGPRARVSAAVTLGLLAALVLFGSLRRRHAGAAAVLIERADPRLQNVVITAEELLAGTDRAPSYMRARVLQDAALRSADLRPSRVAPLKGAATLTAGALVLAVVVGLFAPHPRPSRPSSTAIATAPNGSLDLLVDVVPPSYTSRPATHVRNPATIDAIAGSRATLSLTVVPEGTSPRVRVNGGDLALRRVGQTLVAELTFTNSGYLAIDPAKGATGPGRFDGRLVPISVTPDRAPSVRITAPGRDLRVANTSRSISIEAAATDDLGLSSLEIRYTRISGTGEQFEFHEGTVSAAIERRSGDAWRATGQLTLSALKLEPGDALVYRAVARDGRPGDAGVGTSDTYFVEVAGPGEVALGGFDMPPDRERYALSQQMIVLKIERLRVREASMTRPAVQEAAANIGGEQRAVRANFMFLLGGGVEDEEQEAQASTDILEGRFENQARREIVEAIRLMSLAEHALGTGSTSAALPPARAAAQALQRAFGHSRYLLRTLPSRARIDPAKRLTGDRTSAEDWRRAAAPQSQDPSTVAAREALSDLLQLAASLSDPSSGGGQPAAADSTVADRLGRLAEQVLRIEPGAADLHAAARELLTARDARSAGRLADARAALQRAAPPVLSRAQRARTDVTTRPRLFERVTGALADGGARP